MTNDLPIACSLTAAETAARAAEIADVGRAGLLEADGSVLRFRADRRTRERLQAVIAAESACCPFLSLELDEHPDALVLTITGPDLAAPVVTQLVDAFRGAPTR